MMYTKKRYSRRIDVRSVERNRSLGRREDLVFGFDHQDRNTLYFHSLPVLLVSLQDIPVARGA
jgi:hypothetical protein